MPASWTKKRVSDLRPGDIVKRRPFSGTKIVAGVKSTWASDAAGQVQSHLLAEVRYTDGTSFLFKANVTVLVNNMPPAPASATRRPYSMPIFRNSAPAGA